MLHGMYPSASHVIHRAARTWRARLARHPGWSVKTPGDAQVRDLVRRTDWRRFALTINNPAHLELAARAVALGGIVVYPFGNLYVFSARPAEALVRYVNIVKGRPPEQTGSVVTTPERMAELFDWTRLPRGLDMASVQSLIRGLGELGPFGFRGPAAPGLPRYLTADDNGVRTVQVVSPGANCPSNDLFAQVMDSIPERYLYGTSANRSRQVTGAEDEPCHYRLAPLQADFGRTDGFFMLSSADDCAMQRNYPLHASMSATLVSFHKLGPPDGPIPRVVVERHGSLELERLRAVASRAGLGLWLAPTAQRRLTQRDYALDRFPSLRKLDRAA
jgi:hypothetical protein